MGGSMEGVLDDEYNVPSSWRNAAKVRGQWVNSGTKGGWTHDFSWR
jgi:hypothetical protein